MKELNLYKKTKEIDRLNKYIKINKINIGIMVFILIISTSLNFYVERKYTEWEKFIVKKETIKQGEMKIVEDRTKSGIVSKIVKSDDYKPPYTRITPETKKKKEKLLNEYKRVNKIQYFLKTIVIFQALSIMFIILVSLIYIFKINYKIKPIDLNSEIDGNEINLIVNKTKRLMTVKINKKIISEEKYIWTFFHREHYFTYTLDDKNNLGIVVWVPYTLPTINPMNIKILYNGKEIEKIIC